MALTKLEKDMNIVQALDDEPNDVGGLTALELKAKFDEGGAAVKEYLNDTLTPELDTALDGKTPTTRTVNGHPLSTDVTVTKADVGLGNADNTSDAEKTVSTAQQAALDLKANRTDVLEKTNTTAFAPSADYHPATKKYVDETTAAVVMGTLPDKSVTSDKLADGAVTVEKMASQFYANVSHTHPASDLSTVVPVTGGGTGAADAAGARANLGACTLAAPVTVTLAVASWAGTGPWTQTVTVAGVTASDEHIGVFPVDVSDDAARKLYEKAYGCLSAEADTVAGGVLLTCRDAKPETNFNVKIKGVR